MNRSQHLQWCKDRALDLANSGDLLGAVASMGSDMNKHPDTASPATAMLMMVGMMEAQSGNSAAVRRWIEGFN